MGRKKTRAVLMLALSLMLLAVTQFAGLRSSLCLAAEFACEDETGQAVLAVTGFVTGMGIEAAGILLCVNPWLGLGVGAAYVA